MSTLCTIRYMSTIVLPPGIASTESDADIVGWYPPGGARGQQTARAVDFP